MKTIADIRAENLELLIAEQGSAERVAALCDTSPVYISQLRNKAGDSKTGTPRQVGDAMARKLEVGCCKEVGWMDNLQWPTNHRNHRITHAVQAMQQMGEWQLSQTLTIIDTIALPGPGKNPPENGS